MADDKNKQSASFSLQNEIKKRRTQEIQRAIENKQIERARGDDPKRASQTTPSIPAPDPRRASQQIPALDPRRASQTAQAADPRRASQQIQQLDPRRASQTAQAVEPRRASQQMQAVDPRRASQTTQAADPRRSSQTMKAVDARRTSQTMQAIGAAGTKRASQALPQATSRLYKQRKTMIIGIAVLSIVAVCMLMGLFVLNQPTQAAILKMPPPRTSVDAIAYLRQVGLTVTETRRDVDPAIWAGDKDQYYEVTVQFKGKSQTFLLLSYSDMTVAIADSFHAAKLDNKFKPWHKELINNVLMVVPPNSDKEIIHMAYSHLTTYLLTGDPSSSYRDALKVKPTETPTPAGFEGTATAQAPK